MRKLKSVLSSIYCRWKNLTTCQKSSVTTTRNELHRYWMRPWDGSNLPKNYLKPVGDNRRSQFLLELIKLYTDTNVNILEIGCNVGRNLNYLFLAGFDKLTGIEISEDAVTLMKKNLSRNDKKC